MERSRALFFSFSEREATHNRQLAPHRGSHRSTGSWKIGAMQCPRTRPLVVLLGWLTACAFDPSGTSGDTSDASPRDAAPDARQFTAVHLLLSEVKSGPDLLEFIE